MSPLFPTTFQGCVRGQLPTPKPKPKIFVLEVSSRSRTVLEDPVPTTFVVVFSLYFLLACALLQLWPCVCLRWSSIVTAKQVELVFTRGFLRPNTVLPAEYCTVYSSVSGVEASSTNRPKITSRHHFLTVGSSSSRPGFLRPEIGRPCQFVFLMLVLPLGPISPVMFYIRIVVPPTPLLRLT